MRQNVQLVLSVYDGEIGPCADSQMADVRAS